MLEGIEATIFRTIGDGPSPWESLLPPELLRLPEELARVDALLDDPVFFAPFAPHFHPVIGRPSTPVECYLRLMFLKFRYRLGFESLCAEVSDSISWQAAGGATGTKVTDRRRAAGRRAREMAAQMRARSKLGKDQKTAAIRRVSAGLPIWRKGSGRSRRGAAERPPRGAQSTVRAGSRQADPGPFRTGRSRLSAPPRSWPSPHPAGGADPRRWHPAGQPARCRRPPDPQRPHR